MTAGILQIKESKEVEDRKASPAGNKTKLAKSLLIQVQ